LQVLDSDGNPIEFDKKNVRIVAVERSAEKVLELVEGGEHDHAFYIRGMVPAARMPTGARKAAA
jgi:chaperonin GroEL (HSP60 family)